MSTKPQGRQFGRTVGVFALGAAAGSILALLYAPASGKETRKQIKMRMRALKQQTVQLRNEATERINGARQWVVEHLPNGHAKRPLRRQTMRHA